MVRESGLTIMACCDTEDALSLSRRELNPIGSRALSHDSIFIPEEPVTEPQLEHSMSQENVSDKVRSLQVSLAVVVCTLNGSVRGVCNLFSLIKQKQIAQGIKFGQRPPSLRKSEGDEEGSEEEEVPPSPLKVLAQVEVEPANTEPKVKKKTYFLIPLTV